MADEFNELAAGASTEEPPDDEFVWTDDAGDKGEGDLPDADADQLRPEDTPEYRKLQSLKDQEIAVLRRDLGQAGARMQRLEEEQRAVQDRLDADRLRNATPQQIHAHYQERAKRDAQEQRALTEAQTLQQKIGGRAGQVLQAVGMSRETPGLVFGAQVNWQSYAELLETVIGELREDAESGGAQSGGGSEEEAAVAQDKGKGPAERAAPQRGAARRGRVSTARGRQPVNLWAAYFKELDKVRKGDYHGVVTLRKQFEKRGLDFNKMPQRRRR